MKKEFLDLPTYVRLPVIGLAAADIAAKIAAVVDIVRRPAANVRGPKWVWILAQGINGVGPAAYFLAGRR
ncbi:hypothetical protein FHE74_05710 [Corynebacterium tapiri]|uniref:Cardiolipin synthase N-terminal domain-containing protein n=1 Tax=Corynebacterium tapiri TaxID=1448266 RepID=A0A5C4U3L3_9CORY|nr:hypothetical protein FHE74_05710 [Corynebacterium tapiri]